MKELLTNWEFWTAFLAAIALILSQLPPVVSWFKKAKLDIDIHARAFLTHKIGNPNLQLHLIVRNIGGRETKINSIVCKVIHNKKIIAELPAQNYLSEDSKNNVLLTKFSIKPGQEWSKTLNFLNYFDRKEGQVFRDASKSIEDYVFEKRKEDDKSIHYAPDELVAPLLDQFDRLFIWNDGEYLLQIEVNTDAQEAPILREYRFTLFESQSAEMKEHTKDYSSGAGVYFDYARHSGVLVDLQN
ncbi:hypothetical protein [Reinekea blandensis]|uniref:Uncharacterized protein n=1 Tax=Reinekea blandensis MED297 TaxID=314283 RepID=A4BF88_9GAMM|nr:hypothetical protein [Reinekea blandensis]EAR09201.1 hypothetical protein MED297_06958 [Reinekea sp. MED297] [Reinekea blandensis MED297]